MRILFFPKYFETKFIQKTQHFDAVFLDLDGVLWPNNLDANWFRFNLNKDTKKQIKRLKKLKQKIIIITNQTYGARKFRFKYLYHAFLFVRFQFLLLISMNIDAIYVCTHHPNATQKSFKASCTCRKPFSRLFLMAKSDFNINLQKSIMIGDRITDLYASSGASIKNNYLMVNTEMFKLNETVNFDFFNYFPIFRFVRNIGEVVDLENMSRNIFSNNFQILYLSAGLGTRLKPFTDNVPKPLLKIHGKEILLRLLSQVEQYLPNSAHIVNISYLAEKFAAVPQFRSCPNDISFVYEPIPAGSVNTLLNLAKMNNFANNILVLHGDLFVSARYIMYILDSINNPKSSIVFGHYRLGNEARSSIKIDKVNFVTSIKNQWQVDSNLHLVNSGVYFFRSQDLKKIATLKISGEIADILLPILAEQNLLSCLVNEYPRISLDSISKFYEANKSNFD